LKSKQVQEFKETEIGKIPTDWEVDRIENFLSPEKGSIKIGPFGSQIKREFFVPDGFKVYGQENIFKNDFSLGSRYITNERFEMLSSCELKPNDLIISMMGTIGFMVIVPKNIQKGIMDSHLLRIRIDESRVYNKFLLYALRSTVIQNQIESFSVGTIMPGLNSKIIKQLFFPIPSLSEQQRITKTLLDLDTKIENLQNQNRILEQMAQAIFKSWFVDFDGVTEWDDSELGQIPKGWKVESIDHVSELFDSQRKPLSGIIRSKKQGKFPYYGASGIIDYIDDYIFDGNYLLIAEDGENLRSRNNPIAFFASGKFWVNNHAHIIKPKNNFSMIFLWIFFKKLDLSPWITGAAQPKLNQENLMSIPIIVPPSNQLLVFNSISQTVFKLLQHNNMELKILTKTRDILLPKLMSGEIRV